MQHLTSIAQQLITDQQRIIAENAKDLVAGKEMGLSEATLDRIMLNEERITAMSEAILQLVELADPVGEVLEDITQRKRATHYKKTSTTRCYRYDL